VPSRLAKPFIVDAHALIDYCESDLSVLGTLSRKVQPVHIGRATFDKVRQLSESEATAYRLLIVTPDIETVIAASRRRRSLAYDDHETLLLAQKHGWSCITSDRVLRRECELEGVPTLWGLDPLKLLVEIRSLRPSRALAIARQIQAVNARYITAAIIERFQAEIGRISEKPGPDD